MRYAIYQAPFNQTAWGYSPTADYELVWEGELFEAEGGADATGALDVIWSGFQRVDPDTGPWPPEGYVGRSLSVGDVIVLDGWAPFSVENLGFAAAEGFNQPAFEVAR